MSSTSFQFCWPPMYNAFLPFTPPRYRISNYCKKWGIQGLISQLVLAKKHNSKTLCQCNAVVATRIMPTKKKKLAHKTEFYLDFHRVACGHCDEIIGAWGPGKTRTHCGGNIADVIMFPKCWLVLPRAQHLCRTQILCPTQCFWKSSETFAVSALRATMLPRFATGGQHRRIQCCRHNVSSFCRSLKARLHMRFLMRFLVRFHVQNAPYPTLHECFFREASRGLERKLSHIISRHPSFQFLLNWRYSVADLRDYKPVRGRLWQVLFAKSHRNRMKNRMCKRALSKPGRRRQREEPGKDCFRISDVFATLLILILDQISSVSAKAPLLHRSLAAEERLW